MLVMDIEVTWCVCASLKDAQPGISRADTHLLTLLAVMSKS